MDKTTIEQLNSAAMQIILHAGDCRNLLNEAINDLLDDKSEEEVKDKITQAKKEITKAHVIQTDIDVYKRQYHRLSACRAWRFCFDCRSWHGIGKIGRIEGKVLRKRL